jgi:Sigma-70, region 4
VCPAYFPPVTPRLLRPCPSPFQTVSPTTLASGVALDGSTRNPVAYPFGIWFSNGTWHLAVTSPTAAYLICMNTTIFSITAATFERVFLRSASTSARMDNVHADWREVVLKALDKDELGDALKDAIVSLPLKNRNVLFLHDLRQLDLEETAWILNTNVGAVRARLRRARAQVFNALIASILAKTGKEEMELVASTSGFYAQPLSW